MNKNIHTDIAYGQGTAGFGSRDHIYAYMGGTIIN